MAIEIKMPDLGTNVDTVVLLKWLKKEGDTVKMGEPLCEVQTDKANTELESVASGVLLKQMIEEDCEVSVGTVIAYVGESGETIPE